MSLSDVAVPINGDAEHWRISSEPVIALDGDTAGMHAAMLAVDLALPLLEAGKSLRIALMPEGKDPDNLLIGIQRSPTFSAHFGPNAGRNGSWGEPSPGQPDLLAANQPCWPYRRCLMKRSFYNK